MFLYLFVAGALEVPAFYKMNYCTFPFVSICVHSEFSLQTIAPKRACEISVTHGNLLGHFVLKK